MTKPNGGVASAFLEKGVIHAIRQDEANQRVIHAGDSAVVGWAFTDVGEREACVQRRHCADHG